MKKTILIVALFVLVLSLCACDLIPSSGGNKPGNKSTDSVKEPTESKTEWPASILPPDMPVYPEGSVQTWHTNNDNSEINIVMKDASAASTAAYATMLKGSKWKNDGDLDGEAGSEYTSEKDVYAIWVKARSGGTVNLTVYTYKVVEWLDIIPKDIPKVKSIECKIIDEDESYTNILIRPAVVTYQEAMQYAGQIEAAGYEKIDESINEENEVFSFMFSKGDVLIQFDYYDYAGSYSLQVSINK